MKTEYYVNTDYRIAANKPDRLFIDSVVVIDLSVEKLNVPSDFLKSENTYSVIKDMNTGLLYLTEAEKIKKQWEVKWLYEIVTRNIFD